MIEWIIIGIALIIGVISLYYYNAIIIENNQISNAESQIDVQLKRRADLVPALVETVKGYAKHEKSVFSEVTKARENMMSGSNLKDRVKASNALTGALKTLFALSENYPKLRANENFLQLQEELSSIENKIAYSRQFFNDSVLRFNNLITTIPGKFYAGSRKPRDYLEIDVGEKVMPKIEF